MKILNNKKGTIFRLNLLIQSDTAHSYIKIFYFYIIKSFSFISLIIKLNISIAKYI